MGNPDLLLLQGREERQQQIQLQFQQGKLSHLCCFSIFDPNPWQSSSWHWVPVLRMNSALPNKKERLQVAGRLYTASTLQTSGFPETAISKISV
jgi:hypothetical protein|mmetsp:Transcript_62663/g.103359  ORF Transcript_62663/g.103359 Transcript_62663/m.103359 type:complete len:94 (+) Transcript_62663:227-508(+)